MIVIILLSIAALFIFWIVYSLSATFSLPHGIRSRIEKMTIEEAVKKLRKSKLVGSDLIEQAKKMVTSRMQYCRRNSFDSYKKAFRRGYGYCQQQAFALKYVLTRLGFTAKVVHAYRNKFPDGKVSGHAWVKVVYENTEKDIDASDVDSAIDEINFIPLTKVKAYNAWFRFFAGWGSTGVNAWRYYKFGKDH